MGWDLLDLLREGFRGVPGKVESGPAKHLRSALGQIVNFLYTLQGEAAGAQAISNFDTRMAPFVRYDKLSYKAVKQAIQEFIHNLNTATGDVGAFLELEDGTALKRQKSTFDRYYFF